MTDWIRTSRDLGAHRTKELSVQLLLFLIAGTGMALYLRAPAWGELLLGLGMTLSGILLAATIGYLGWLNRFAPVIEVATYALFRWLILQDAGPEKAAWIGFWASASWLILTFALVLIIWRKSGDSPVDERILWEMDTPHPFGPLNLALGLSRIAMETGYCLLAASRPELALAPLGLYLCGREWRYPLAVRQLTHMALSFPILVVGIGISL
ncbi:hypothetical protein AB0L05_14300 [Nonomuraea pusilla]|uniref:hypothetical protein n=1 Tax=Nonomuraea pusilla TaxID=46177 RepID=UPI003324B9A8